MAGACHGKGYVYSIQDHIVWCIKYRKEILRGVIDKTLQNVIHKIAREHEINKN